MAQLEASMPTTTGLQLDLKPGETRIIREASWDLYLQALDEIVDRHGLRDACGSRRLHHVPARRPPQGLRAGLVYYFKAARLVRRKKEIDMSILRPNW